MSKPKPIYETPWMELANGYFGHCSAPVSLCKNLLEPWFEIGPADKIKIAIFTRGSANMVRITENKGSFSECFFCDSKATLFLPSVDVVLRTLLRKQKTDTLYVKVYTEA